MQRLFTYLILSFLFLQASNKANAQNTVGLLSYQPWQSYDGFNLIYPHNQPNVYLLDNCGEIVHVWTDSVSFRPGNTAYLRPDGSIVKTKRGAAVANDAIWAGGGGDRIEIRDWDNNLIWSYSMNTAQYRLHHDIALMPNGHILAIAWELKTEAEALAAGRDTANTPQDKLWPDWVFEIDPSTDSIVWEWHAWDHLIQDFDSTKANYGVVSEHPERININYDTNNGHPDWLHGNALDFNAELNQIMLSVPQFDEVWIIDHTTTTAQAASHFGGFGNRGGDLMFRWGNPAAYNQGDSTDQRLYYQHDTHWIGEFLPVTHPLYGKIAVFNNRFMPNYSVGSVFTPAWDMYEWQYMLDDGRFLPSSLDEVYAHPTPTEMYSTGLSSVQHLPNGNVLLCSGRTGYAFEMTPNRDIVWEYKTPLRAGQPTTQGDALLENDNLTFRMKRYPTDYAAFVGKDLSGKGWIELNPDSTFCAQIVPTNHAVQDAMYKIYPNPASNQITIEWDGMQYANIEIYNTFGQKVASEMGIGGRKYVDVSQLIKGMYFVRIDGHYTRRLVIGE